MQRVELITRITGIDQWLRFNRHNANYKGVKLYHQRLLKLLYKSKPN